MFFGGYKIRDRSLPFRLWSEVVCWGVVQAGVWSIFAAQHSDIFGERPTLSSEIRSKDEMWSSVAKTIGPFLSFACAKTVGSYFSEYLVSAFTAISMIVLLSVPETLMDDRPEGSAAWVIKKNRQPAHRKKFRLATANPFANIALLVRNGVHPTAWLATCGHMSGLEIFWLAHAHVLRLHRAGSAVVGHDHDHRTLNQRNLVDPRNLPAGRARLEFSGAGLV